ncbi:MAG: exodeoxyribonuclease VII large subunit, partial [Maricaulis maris]
MNTPAGNIHEFTVSELAGSLKRTVEDAFGHVRLRGELGRVVVAKSGHVYFDIKDDKAVIASIAWKG